MKRAAALLVLALLLLAGCATMPAAVTPASGDARASPAPALVVPRFRAPVDLGAAGPDGAEPNLVVTPQDHVFVTNAPTLWRSRDGGATFEAVSRGALDAPGDMDLAADANGTLYFAGLQGKSGAVPFQASRDDGDSWSAPIDLAKGNRTDRQWIDALPDGTVYVTWRDYGSAKDANPPKQLLFRRSGDGGATWDAPVRIGNDDLEGPIAHDPRDGRSLYVALYDRGIQMARSRDGGASWDLVNVTRAPQGRQANGDATSIHIITAVDAAGTAYVVWSDDERAVTPLGSKELWVPSVKMAVSRDGGASWSAPIVVSPEGRAAVLPWIVAGKAGRVAVSWYEARNGVPTEDAPDVWDVVLAESVTADGSAPTFVRAVANGDRPVHWGPLCTNGGGCDRLACVNDVAGVAPPVRCVPTRVCATDGVKVCAGRDRSRLDLFELALRPNGQPIVVWAQDPDASAVTDRSVRVVVATVESGTPIG